MQEDKDNVHIGQLFATTRPPKVPDEGFRRDNANLYAVKTWKRSFAAAILAGLLTEPAFYANGVRLDWLQRLVLSKATGPRKPKPHQIGRALNIGLEKAHVLRLEDPTEDLFCDLIVTSRGHFRIFSGLWETPGPYTQTLLDAFESSPPTPRKDFALRCVYALLKLSEEAARRTNIDRLTPTGGDPGGMITVPDAETLKRLSQRVRFSNEDLARLGIDRDALEVFCLQPEHFQYISSHPPGDSPLEFYPLLGDSSGLTVVSPAAISLAIRGLLVTQAQSVRIENALLLRLLIEQERHAETSIFWPAPRLNLGPPDQHFLRTSILQLAAGRYLQIIQVPVTFDQFPDRGFASVRVMPQAVTQAIADRIAEFWQHLRQTPVVRASTTVLLLSGWGTPHALDLPIKREEAPPDWQYVALTFADAATLGACENGKFASIRRILEQVACLEAHGFSLENASGTLNLFAFWRTTKGNLVPEHIREMEPPCRLYMPTDELLATRKEAATKQDIRALPYRDGIFRRVQRVDWSQEQPVYASLTDLEQGRLIGAVAMSARTWWVESVDRHDAPREWRYRIWHAVLQWLAAVGPTIIQRYPAAFPVAPAYVSIACFGADAWQTIAPKESDGSDLPASITVNRQDQSGPAEIEISGAWLPYITRPQNDAEIELIGAILEGLSSSVAASPSREELRVAIREAIGSSDWRWMHAREAFTPIERLAHAGLVEQFKEIPLSAFALVKCGSVWQFRDRSQGVEINGEGDCRHFLAQYREDLLHTLITRIRRFTRDRLIVLAAARYQAARQEQSQWHIAIRAMRAIEGLAADQAAFKRQNEMNAVRRAAKIVMEVAACEAGKSDDVRPDQYDLDKLFSMALLLFSNGQLFASIRAGLVEPKLRISPAGDLLSDRSVFEAALAPAVKLTATKVLDQAGESYKRGGPKYQGTDSQLPFDDTLRRAIEAEYGAPAEAVIDLQYAILQLAESQRSGVLVMPRSEMAHALSSNSDYSIDDPTALLERLTLRSRSSWDDCSSGLTKSDLELSRFDRPFSLINRPLLALDDDADPRVLIAPILVSDSTMYALSGLIDGSLQNQFWTSKEAKSHVGKRAGAAGLAFEDRVAETLRSLGLRAWTRRPLSWALNQKVDDELGDIDVLAVSADRRRVWVIEAKDLRLCRTEAEVAARLSEYRGRAVPDAKGREKPDKMRRHIRRVTYLRERRSGLCERLELDAAPEVHGLVIVDSPQPMNFYMLDQLEDGQSAFLGGIDTFTF